MFSLCSVRPRRNWFFVIKNNVKTKWPWFYFQLYANDLEKSNHLKLKGLDKKKDLLRWYGIQWCKQIITSTSPAPHEHLLILVNLKCSLLSFEWIGRQRTYPNTRCALESNTQLFPLSGALKDTSQCKWQAGVELPHLLSLGQHGPETAHKFALLELQSKFTPWILLKTESFKLLIKWKMF